MKKTDYERKLPIFVSELKYDEKSAATYKQYDRVCKSFLKSIKHDNDITKEDVMRYKSEMISEFKPSTIRNYITIVNKFVFFCEYDDLDRRKRKSELEVKQIKMQHVSSLDDVLEPQELKRMLRFAKKMGYMDMYLIMKIFAHTGIREHELKDFTVENLKKNIIRTNSKGKIREIILPGDLKREINKYIKENNLTTGYIFTAVRDKNKLISMKTIWWRLKKIAGRAKIKLPKVHAHSFRHLFAMWYIEQGGTVEELADILGHTSTETTRIYLRSTAKMKKKKLEKLKY